MGHDDQSDSLLEHVDGPWGLHVTGKKAFRHIGLSWHLHKEVCTYNIYIYILSPREYTIMGVTSRVMMTL